MLVLIKFGILRTIQARTWTECGTTSWNSCDTLSDVECLYRGPHYMHRPHRIRHSNSASIYNSPDARPHHTQHNTNTGFVAFIHSFIIQRVLHCRPALSICTKHELITLSNKTKSRVLQTLHLLDTTKPETVQGRDSFTCDQRPFIQIVFMVFYFLITPF